MIPKRFITSRWHDHQRVHVSPALVESATADADDVLRRLATRSTGLTDGEADARRAVHGANVLATDDRVGFVTLLRHAVLNPLVILLAILAGISFATGDVRAGTIMMLMIVLGAGLKLVQESRADIAAARLKAMIAVRATVLRDGLPRETPMAGLVPGDVVVLAAGDMIPADVRLLTTKDLFVNQAALTGESYPVEKLAVETNPSAPGPLEHASIAFLGTSVESGSGTAVIVATGRNTYLGGMATLLTDEPLPTSFDEGISRLTWLMIRFVVVMAPLVFAINGLTKGNWHEASLFAVAVAVGLTPEMLPMVVAVCLSKGALAMSRKRVIVKRLSAIQNLGAMDVLCTDKTGTLTMDRVILERHCDVALRDSAAVLGLAYINSHFQTGLRNVLDRAVLAHTETHAHARIPEYVKVDEIPFDFQRRIMSVVVRTPRGHDLIVCKGAPEAIFSRCTRFALDGRLHPMDHVHIRNLRAEHEQLSADGFRVLAIACKEKPGRAAGDATPYTHADESDLVLQGYVAFFDPPKESAGAALRSLQRHGVNVKVLTGDNDLVARKICREVGLPTQSFLLGADIDAMTDERLAEAAVRVTLFARVTPSHKQRIIEALRSRNHTVGFLGDGINDAPALRAADVGISVDTAVDVAKASADMILLEKSLLVLDAGVVEGRKIFANILKYVRMGASSNFGNMLSVVGASSFVPYLPMLPIQILALNLLYDIGQTAIPTDDVDPEQVDTPRPWDMGTLTRFIVCIGPCSSFFDYTTYFVMLAVFGCWETGTPEAARHSASLFQTGWFVESLITQALIIHVIRTDRIPFLESRPSWPLMVTSSLIVAVGVAMPSSPLRGHLGLVPLPAAYWPCLALTIVSYAALTMAVKAWLLRRGLI